VTVVLNERDEGAVNKLSSGKEKQPESGRDTSQQLGLSVTNLTDEARQQLNLASDVSGVVVTEVDQASQAAGEGVQPGDVVQEINRQPVASVKDFTKIAKSVKPGNSVLLLVRRGQSSLFVAFTLRGK
jgi:serine protease Do